MDEQSLPIDINYNRLLEWLLSRRHIKSDWFKQENVVNEKIRRAKAVSGDKLAVSESPDYWEVCDYVTKSKDQQNANGSKLWLEAQRAFEKDAYFLGETAQRMARNVNYEIPALKRIVDKARRSEQECEQRAADAEANGIAFTNRFRTACTQYGIAGVNIGDELARRAREEAPAHFDTIVGSVRLLKDLLAFRDAFVRFTQRRGDDSLDELAKLIRTLTERGNCTIYELETGQAPPAEAIAYLENVDLHGKQDEAAADADDSGEICWDIDEPAEPELAELNIEIEVVESNVGDAATAETVKPEAERILPSKAQLMTLLEDSERRGVLLNELFELQAFLHVRTLETSSNRIASDVIVTLELQSLADALQSDSNWSRSYTDAEAHFAEWLANVRTCIEQLTNVRFVRTMRIRESAAYLERLAAQLEEMRRHAAKNARLAETLRARASEWREDHTRTQPLVRSLAQRTLALKRQAEAQISKRYKNRPVNILGEIYAACSC